MFGIPAWAIIATAGVVGLVLLVFGACVRAGQKPHPRPPRHQRQPRSNYARTTREDWLAGTDIIPRAEVAGAPPWTVQDEPGPLTRQMAQVIEGPWGTPVRQYPVEDLPAPELLDDLPPVPEHLIRHAYAYDLHPQPAAELDENLPPDQDAFGLCGCMCLCWDGADGPDNLCSRCRAGNHAPRRADDDDPGWVTRIRAELADEDQAAEPDEIGDLPPDLDRYSRHAELSGAYDDPELVLAEEAHAAQLRELDADTRAFMEAKAAEFAELRQSLTGPR